MNCSKKDCRNDAVVYPKLMVKPKNYECDYCPMILKFPLCMACKFSAKLEDFVDDSGWERILKVFEDQGLVKPCRKLTKLEWERMRVADKVFDKNE